MISSLSCNILEGGKYQYMNASMTSTQDLIGLVGTDLNHNTASLIKENRKVSIEYTIEKYGQYQMGYTPQ